MACLALILILSAIPAFAAQPQLEETVVVTASAAPVPFENLSRTVTVLTREDIVRLPVNSIADVLAQALSVDVRSRSPHGMQSDISVRGSAFSQVLILVDGIRINNSQTGHHNSDFPVQLQDVERMEVLLGAGSSLYGADAVGGVINIITRRRTETTEAAFSVGQFNFLEASASTGFRKGSLQQSVSILANRSSGFQYGRDCSAIAVSSRTQIGDQFGLFVSHTNKEFGAKGFYGPAPSREWTNQTLVAAEHTHCSRSGLDTSVKLYYRTHGDRFQYDFRHPDLYENRHRTHAAGLLAQTRFGISDKGVLAVGGELGGDWIASSNLGDHSYARTSLFGELQWMLGSSAIVYPGIRLDHYSNFGTSVSPSLSGSWWIAPRIRLRSSVGRSFRIPTFTEFLYRDPNHQANPLLEPESAWVAEIAADFIPAKEWLGFAAVYSRHERNVIDWIRSSPDEKWRTYNIRELHAKGFEVGIERALGAETRVAAHYSRISMDAGKVDYQSKYILDYARDTWTVKASVPILPRLEYQNSLRYKRRIDGRSYWLLDGRVESRFRRFRLAFEFANLLDSQYQEIIGVDMPGRYIAITLRTR